MWDIYANDWKENASCHSIELGFFFFFFFFFFFAGSIKTFNETLDSVQITTLSADVTINFS